MNQSKIVAVACDGAAGLAGNVSGHFGHAPYFVVAEIVEDRVTTTRSVSAPTHGEGCSMPGFVQSLGVTSAIVGGIGDGAANGLAARGIEVIAGVVGNVGDVLRAYATGKLITGKPGCHGHGDHDCHHHH